MRIVEDTKLDYKDVLFQPKRSKLESRRDVEMLRTFTFHNQSLFGTVVSAVRTFILF